MKKYVLLPLVMLELVFGKLRWSPPVWLQKLFALAARHRRVSLSVVGVLLAVLFAVGGYWYLASQPKPGAVNAVFYPPELQPNGDVIEPMPLRVEFAFAHLQAQPAVDSSEDQAIWPVEQPSVARMDLIGETLTKGITMSPAKAGSWRWSSERELVFTPETDWPAGIEYTVHFDSSLFAEGIHLSNKSGKFSTAPLAIDITKLEFYQDPLDVSLRRVVSTFTFSQPIDKSSFENQLQLGMRAADAALGDKLKPWAFSVSYDKNLREAYVQSDPVALPEHSSYMHVTLGQGVKALAGGQASEQEYGNRVLIPDAYSFLKVASVRSEIVRNQKNQPEQVVMLEFTDDIARDELLGKLSMYLLPATKVNENDPYWQSPREVTAAHLASSTRLNIDNIPNPRDYAKNYHFIIDVPEGRAVYVKIEPKLSSVNKFVHASFYDALIHAPAYPKEVSISGEGALISRAGEKKLSVLTRGVSTLKYSLGKLLEGQIYHLVSQTNGDISNPSFNNWSFDKTNLAEFETRFVDIASAHPKQASYSSLELSSLMPERAAESSRFGLFFVDVRAWDKNNNHEIYDANAARLILVTDLGLIVKNNADQSHAVFVQSISTGLPVAGARVELLGKNGIPLYSLTTSEQGYAEIPSTRDFYNEKEPTVYVVKTANDISFIPFNRYSRQINLSRFDIGGVYHSPNQQDALNAYLFSDRGIYRPGETIHLGMVVKKHDLSSVGEIPLEVVVQGPRYNEVKVEKIRLTKTGFMDFAYATEAVSDTGEYQVSLYVVGKNNQRDRQIGSTRFSLEEFQPDSMKIESRLLGVSAKGWSKEKELTAQVNLKNLFGTPAQDRAVQGQLIIKPARFNFKEFPGYHFTDTVLDEETANLEINEVLPQQSSDADGLANFTLNLERFQAGTYQLQFIAEGFSPDGGRSVKTVNSALISPLDFIVGYKADGKLDYIHSGAERKVTFIAIDKMLNPIARDDLIIKHIELQQLSTLVKQNDGTYQYQTVQREKELQQRPFSLAERAQDFVLDTREPGDFVVEIHDKKQNKLARVAYSVAGYGNLDGKIDKNAELQVKLNQSDYKIGDNIEVHIKAPYAGAGLISIETDKVHSFRWFKTEVESTVQSIPVPEGLEGTAYVNVAFVRDAASKEIFTSPLSYAVQPFSIDRSKRSLKVDVQVADLVRPGKAMEIAYSTSETAKIAIYAVDEGILQVANYTLPDPLDHFLKKRALQVDTLQIMDLILPEFQMLKRLSAIGGDAAMAAMEMRAMAKNLNPFARKTDAPAIFWSGVIDADTQTKTVSFTVPDTFSGSLKIMAVAVSEEAMGSTSVATIARGPFVISPNVLTQAAPGDEFVVTAGIANIIDGSGKNAEVQVAISASKHLEILGAAEIKLAIDEGSEGKASFRVRALPQPGAAEITVTATHKQESLSRSASLSVRPAVPYYSSFISGHEKSGELDLPVPRRLFASLAEQKIAASASPLVLVDGLNDYLKHFPHGCTEQVVSKVFPLIGLMTHPAWVAQVPEVQKQLDYVIARLRERQMDDGGFAFWPGHYQSAEYPSIYVMHFLLEASEQGYPVPQDMLMRGGDYLLSYVANSANNLAQARERAQAIYILTRAGQVTTNYLIDLEEFWRKEQGKEWSKDIGSVYMAATYSLLQKQDEANRLIGAYEPGAKQSSKGKNAARLLLPTEDFYSSLALDAQYLYLLAKHFPAKAKSMAGDDVLFVTEKIMRGEYNTIAAAYSILALGAYGKLALPDPLQEQIQFFAQREGQQKELLTASATPFLTATYPVDTLSTVLSSASPVFYLNVQSGFDQKLPPALAQGLEIQRDFLDDKGNKVSELKQGQELTVRLRLRSLSDRALYNIAITDLLPGGFEVLRSSLPRAAPELWTKSANAMDYIDIREDRVVFYGQVDTSLREIVYRVKVSAEGKFVIPPSVAESMYDRSLRAVSGSGEFVVKGNVVSGN